jgi:hypothetical protein|tara:strand:- start:423 stop:614 length:192 start_codon:yes stop_codon:yes gene_type:complete
MNSHSNSIIKGMFSSEDPVATIRSKQIDFSRSMDELPVQKQVKDYSVGKHSTESGAGSKKGFK